LLRAKGSLRCCCCPRYPRLEELRSRERKHDHIAHPSAIGVCFEKDITAREKMMGFGWRRECLRYPPGQLSFGENILFLAHALGQEEFVKGKEQRNRSRK
jgi:hypothetical protein